MVTYSILLIATVKKKKKQMQIFFISFIFEERFCINASNLIFFHQFAIYFLQNVKIIFVSRT